MLNMNENLDLFANYLAYIKSKNKNDEQTANLVNTFWNITETERKTKIDAYIAGGAEPVAPENSPILLETELWELLSNRGIDAGNAQDREFINHVYHRFEYADDKFQELHTLRTYTTDSNVAPHIKKYKNIQKQLRDQLYDKNNNPISKDTYNGGYCPEQIDYIFREKARAYPQTAFIDSDYIFGGRGDPSKVLADELAPQPADATTLLTGFIDIGVSSTDSNPDTHRLKEVIGTLMESPQQFDNIVIPLGARFPNPKKRSEILGHVITMVIDKDKNVQIIDQVGNADNSTAQHKQELTAMLKELGFAEDKIIHNTQKLSEPNRNDCATFSSYLTEELLQGNPIPNDNTVPPVITHAQIDTQHEADQDHLILSTARLYLDDPLFCMYYKDLGNDVDEIKRAIDSYDLNRLKNFINDYKNYHLSDNVKGHIGDGNPSNAHQGLPAEEWKDEVDPHIQTAFQEYEVPFKEERDDQHPDWLIYRYGERSIIFTKNANDELTHSYINSDQYVDYLILAKTYKSMGENKVQFDFEDREKAAKMLKAAYSVGLDVVNAPDLESFRDLPDYADIKKLYYTHEYNKNALKEKETLNLMNGSVPPAPPATDERTDEQKEYYNLLQAHTQAKDDINGSALPPAGTPDTRTVEQIEYYNLRQQEKTAKNEYERLMHGDSSTTPPVAPVLDTNAVNHTYREIIELQKALTVEQAKATPDAAEIARLQGEISAKETSSPYREYRQARNDLSQAQKNLKESTLGKALSEAEKNINAHPFNKDLKTAQKQKNNIMSEAIDFYVEYGNTGNDADRERVEKLLRISSLIMPEDRREEYINRRTAQYDANKDKILKESHNLKRTAHKLSEKDRGTKIVDWYQQKQKQYS